MSAILKMAHYYECLVKRAQKWLLMCSSQDEKAEYNMNYITLLPNMSNRGMFAQSTLKIEF